MAVTQLSTRRRFTILAKVARETYHAAPFAVIIQLFGALINAVLPLITAYFAALTTTALAAAYSGDGAAGQQAIWYVIITALLGVTSVAWSSVEQYIGQLARYKIDSNVNDRLYRHFVGLEYWRYDDKATADMFDKAQNFASYFSFIFRDIASMFSNLVQMVIAIIALTILQWWLGVLLIVAVVPSMYVQLRLSRLQAAHWKENVSTRRAMNGIKWSVFQAKNIAELRVYGVVKYMLDWFSRLRDVDEKQRIDFERKFIGRRLLADVIQSVAELAILIFTVLAIIARTRPIGQFIYVQQLVQRALSGANALISLFSSRDEDLATLFDFDEFMSLPQGDPGAEPLQSVPERIAIKDVTFSYPESHTKVLHGVSLTIPRNTHVAIVGENGAGKSTLIKLLLGLYLPDSGVIELDGRDLAFIKKSDWHAKIGLLQQEFIQYWFASARDNVWFGDTSHRFDHTHFDHALERAEARQFVERLPKGADTLVDKWAEDEDGSHGVNLSGGQWQRIALARNFYRDSPVIILDEPTSAIDALAEARIFRQLFEDKSRTVITVSHRLSTIRKADQIYMMQDGRIIEQGTYDELISRKGEFYRMFESQIK